MVAGGIVHDEVAKSIEGLYQEKDCRQLLIGQNRGRLYRFRAKESEFRDKVVVHIPIDLPASFQPLSATNMTHCETPEPPHSQGYTHAYVESVTDIHNQFLALFLGDTLERSLIADWDGQLQLVGTIYSSLFLDLGLIAKNGTVQ